MSEGDRVVEGYKGYTVEILGGSGHRWIYSIYSKGDDGKEHREWTGTPCVGASRAVELAKNMIDWWELGWEEGSET